MSTPVETSVLELVGGMKVVPMESVLEPESELVPGTEKVVDGTSVDSGEVALEK